MTIPGDSRWNSLRRLFQFAIITVGGALAISLAVAAGRFRAAFGESAVDNAPEAQLSIVLMLVSCALIAAWYFATSGELEMLQTYGREFVPTLPDIRLQTSGLAVLLALLVYFSNRPLVYSGVFSFFKLFEIWILWIRDSKIRDGLEVARSSAASDDERRPKWEVIERYYLRRPHIPLVVTVLWLAMAALSLSIPSEVLDDRSDQRIYSGLAYSLLIVSIVAQEVVIFSWRKERDRGLGEHFLW